MSCSSVLLRSLLLGAVSMSNAQEPSIAAAGESRNLMTLFTGISVHAVRDEMISPLLYRGTQAPIALAYRYRGSENRHSLLLSYDETRLHSSITQPVNGSPVSHYINNLHLNLDYSFSTKAAVIEDLNTTFFIGARFSSILNLRKHWFFQDKNHMSAEQMTGLGINVLTETVLPLESDNVLRAEINVPCVSYVLLGDRYNANVGEKLDNLDLEKNLLWQLFKRGDVVTFNKLFELQADVSYTFFVSGLIGLDLEYRVLFYSFAQYQDLLCVRVLSNQLLLGLTVRL